MENKQAKQKTDGDNVKDASKAKIRRQKVGEFLLSAAKGFTLFGSFLPVIPAPIYITRSMFENNSDNHNDL